MTSTTMRLYINPDRADPGHVARALQAHGFDASCARYFGWNLKVKGVQTILQKLDILALVIDLDPTAGYYGGPQV